MNKGIEDPGNRKSILIFCDITSGGGVYVYTKNLIDILFEKGFSFYLITHEPVNELDKNRLKNLSSKISGSYTIQNGITDDAILREISLCLENIKPDYYIPNYRNAPHAALIRAKAIGCQTIFVAHNDHFDQYKYAVRYQNQIDFFISPSKKGHKTLISILRKQQQSRVWYVPHSIDSPESKPEKERELGTVIRLVYSGRVVYEQKQLYFLPLIAAEMNARNINFQMNIIGDGASKETLIKEFRDTAIEDSKVKFHGYVPHEELVGHIRNNDIAILVSSYEGFCLGLAEAMSQGLPCIAFSCGGVIDDYLRDGESGFLVDQGDVTQFVNKVEILTKNPELYRQLSFTAEKIVRESFNKSYVSELYVKVLKEVSTLAYEAWPVLRPVLISEKRDLIEAIGCMVFKWPVLKRSFNKS